jgi:hypothetical protein
MMKMMFFFTTEPKPLKQLFPFSDNVFGKTKAKIETPIKVHKQEIAFKKQASNMVTLQTRMTKAH